MGKRKKTSLKERLLRRIVKVESEYGECWIWQGKKDKDGYGQDRGENGEYLRTHRAAFEIYHCSIEPGNVILHSCHNPSCINPDHLSQGTQQENMKDRDKAEHTAIGEKNGQAKLLDNEVREIKWMLHKEFPIDEIAAKFKVNVATIKRIARGNQWGHIKRPRKRPVSQQLSLFSLMQGEA